MACIFCEVPYVVFGVRKTVFCGRIFCDFSALNFSFLMIQVFAFRPGAQFLLLHALPTRIAGHAKSVFLHKQSVTMQKVGVSEFKTGVSSAKFGQI